MVRFVALEKRALHQPNRQRSDYKKRRVATGKQMMIIGEPGSGKSHLHASSISTAKDAKNSSECHDLSMASLGDFGILRNEGGGP